MRNHRFTFFLLMLSLGFLESCQLIKGLKNVSYIKNEFVNTQRLSQENQEIILVEMAHFGQKIFYDSLRDSIGVWKAQGYRMYYEEINSHPVKTKADSLSVVSYKKKWRRINGGFVMDRSHYENLNKVFKQAIVQPEWVDLGITETDLNADITLRDLIREYERSYGEVMLDSCDLDTSLDDAYTCAEALKYKLDKILLDFRNEKVIEHIQQHEDRKIVILYGANHIKGLYKALRKS